MKKITIKTIETSGEYKLINIGVIFDLKLSNHLNQQTFLELADGKVNFNYKSDYWPQSFIVVRIKEENLLELENCINKYIQEEH